jgi:hypothetical protein
MNMRRHKHFVQNKVWAAVFENYWQGVIDRALTPTPEEQAASDARHKEWADKLFKDIGMVADSVPAVDPMVTEFLQPRPGLFVPKAYSTERVKDGIATGDFDTREEALAMLNKHHKQKKAKLQVRNNRTGELEVFTTDEMFA